MNTVEDVVNVRVEDNGMRMSTLMQRMRGAARIEEKDHEERKSKGPSN